MSLYNRKVLLIGKTSHWKPQLITADLAAI